MVEKLSNTLTADISDITDGETTQLNKTCLYFVHRIHIFIDWILQLYHSTWSTFNIIIKSQIQSADIFQQNRAHLVLELEPSSF